MARTGAQRQKREASTSGKEDHEDPNTSPQPTAKRGRAGGGKEAVRSENQPLVEELLLLSDAAFEAARVDSKNRFKGVALRRKANAIGDLDEIVCDGDRLAKEGPRKIPGVGKGTAAYVDEFLETGEIQDVERYRSAASSPRSDESKSGDEPRERMEAKGKSKPSRLDPGVVSNKNSGEKLGLSLTTTRPHPQIINPYKKHEAALMMGPQKVPKKDHGKKPGPLLTNTGPNPQIINPYKKRRIAQMIQTKAKLEEVKEVKINRAPVLTLWVAIVAERQGFSSEEAYTYGKWVAGTLAQSKGRALGIYERKEVSEENRAAKRRQNEQLGVRYVEPFGSMKIPVAVKDGKRLAVTGGRPLSPGACKAYIDRAFGDNLDMVKAAMRQLCDSTPPEELRRHAYHLYEQFRPAWLGWGMKGSLCLDTIRGLADM